MNRVCAATVAVGALPTSSASAPVDAAITGRAIEVKGLLASFTIVLRVAFFAIDAGGIELHTLLQLSKSDALNLPHCARCSPARVALH